MNVIFGNTISAVLGVCVAKLFELQRGFKIGGVYEPNWECVLVLVFLCCSIRSSHTVGLIDRLLWRGAHRAASVSLALALLVMQLLEIT